MLPRENRLTRRNDFRDILNKGKFFQGKLVALALLRDQENNEPQIGIIVSTKISKLATKRNRIKRIIKEALRTNMLLGAGQKMVVLTKKTIIDASPGEIRLDLKRALEKARHEGGIH